MIIQNINNKQYGLSFTAMKSSAFTGFDYACMRKFKAPIEKFKSLDDFYIWAEKNFYRLSEIDLKGRNDIVVSERKKMLSKWVNFLSGNKNLLSPSLALLAFSSIIKNLKPDNETVPPEINEDVFVKTIDNLESDLIKNRDYKFDLEKIYRKNLLDNYLDDNISGHWLIIPSKTHDEANYAKNLEKLKFCSYRTWCTKNIKAEDYLLNGDIHIYFENNNPKIGIRFRGETMEDVSGLKNDGKIPLEYLDIVKEHIKINGYKTGYEVNCELEAAEDLRQTINKINKDLGNSIKNKDVFKILDYFNFKPVLLEDGTISIDGWRPLIGFSFSDLGISENDLFKKISEIRGSAYFRKTGVTDLGVLNRIKGDVNFADSQVRSLGNLEFVDGSIYFVNSKITDAGILKKAGGLISIQKSLLTEEDLKNTVAAKIVL